MEEQLNLVFDVCDTPLILHFDATGSVVKNIDGHRVFYYSLVAKSKFEQTPCLPLLQFLSNSQSALSIKRSLSLWWDVAQECIDPPSIIVTDFSWALLHACCAAFNGFPLQNFLKHQWDMLVSGQAQNITLLRLCVNHYMKSLSSLFSRHKIKKPV